MTLSPANYTEIITIKISERTTEQKYFVVYAINYWNYIYIYTREYIILSPAQSLKIKPVSEPKRIAVNKY